MTLQKKIIIAASIIVLISALAGGAYFILNKNSTVKYNFVPVTKGNIAQIINLTGNVKAAESVKLAFEKSAKISQVNFKVGDKIKTGQLIAGLVSTDIIAQLAQAQAAYDAQVAVLKNLQAGTRPEDIQISKTQVQNAEKNTTDAQTNLTNIKLKADNDLSTLYNKTGDLLNDAYTKTFDALYNKTDGIFNNGSSEQPTLAINISNSALANSLEQNRPLKNQELRLMKNEIDIMGSDQSNIDSTLLNALSHLDAVRDYLNDLSDALNYAMNSAAISQSQILNYKSNINLGLTNINNSLTAINNQLKTISAQKITNQNSIALTEAQLNQANNNLLLAKNQLTLKQASATTEQIATQDAAIRQAGAAAQNIRAQLSKSSLISPINGTVSQQDAKVGEIAPMNIPLISIISDAKFQIEAQVAEADIEKIKIGQTAEITLDADNSRRILQAKVILIDPAKTIANGSATYKITLEFTEENPLIKDGLTANLKIITEQKTNALLIPTSSIIKQYDKIMVLKNNNSGGVEQIYITAGINQDGLTEILSGLNQGDKVASFGKN